MFSDTKLASRETLTDGFISMLEDDLIEENPYLLAAQEKECELSAKVIADFACLQFHIETIVPIFNSAAYPMINQTGRISNKGWAVVRWVFNDSWAGRIRGDATNKVLTRIRRLQKQAYEATRMGKPQPQ